MDGSEFHGDGSVLLSASLVHSEERAYILYCLDTALSCVHHILPNVLSWRNCSPWQVNCVLIINQ
jgi:hypothetical protein